MMPRPDFDINVLLAAPNAILAIAVVLGLGVFFHEAGHFLAARLAGIAVEEFAIGFGPALLRRRIGATTYSLRVVPVGGFARIAGMEAGQADLPDGIYAKPRYVQALVFAGGVLMNVVLALLFFLVVTFWKGLPDEKEAAVVIDRTIAGSVAQKAGLASGDRIAALDGHRASLYVAGVKRGSRASRAGVYEGMYIAFAGTRAVAAPTDLGAALLSAPPGGLAVTVSDPKGQGLKGAYKQVRLSVDPALRAELAALRRVPAGAADERLGRLLGIEWGGVTTGSVGDYTAQRPGVPFTMEVLRAGEVVRVTLAPAPTWERVPEVGPDGVLRAPFRQVGRIGIVLGPPRHRPGLVEGVKTAAYSTVGSVAMMVGVLKAMFFHEVEADLGGPIAIMAMTAEQARIGWDAVLNWGGLISANLAIVNLLPFPPFDGSYLLILGFEAVARQRISERFRLAVMAAGMVLILMLFVAFTYRDIINLVLYRTP
jgi:regulator of sigma E protease